MIRRFEDLIAWQKARGLTKRIYLATRDGPVTRDFRFSGQIRSAGVSVMANIAEGFERGGLGEFHQFLSTAKGSCAEVRSHLYVALDVGYLDEESFRSLMNDAEEVGRVVGGLRASVERQRDNRNSC
ncbi:MAG TPA: four helix bundle protein [Gemmataceae bacterium]|nr:four helix bundle protein [Gemmataceae bacterium]